MDNLKCSVLFFILFTTFQNIAYSETYRVETISWDILKDIKGVENFEGKAWFCQAKTPGGKTECHLGNQPPKPGCYVLVNPNQTAWISVDDAAAQLKSEYITPENAKEKGLSSASGYGCGVPGPGAYWLLWKIKSLSQ